MPVFENGWICRECWSANREQDSRCYRCHAVPKRREMPEPVTFSTPEGKPNEERRKVSSLTGTPPPPPAQPTRIPEPVEPATPRQAALMVQLRAFVAALGRNVSRVMRFLRAVPGAPRRAWQFASGRLHTGLDSVKATANGIISHRRAWLTVAWLISAFSCALLFSVALNAPLPASLLVVASVAIFSGLSAAITTNASERRDRRAGDAPQQEVGMHEIGDSEVPAPILGTHAGR